MKKPNRLPASIPLKPNSEYDRKDPRQNARYWTLYKLKTIKDSFWRDILLPMQPDYNTTKNNGELTLREIALGVSDPEDIKYLYDQKTYEKCLEWLWIHRQLMECQDQFCEIINDYFQILNITDDEKLSLLRWTV